MGSGERILVVGATGRLGRLVTARLLAEGVPVRVLTRSPDRAHALFGDAAQVAAGDLDAPASLEPALAGVGRVFLLSPISERLAGQQVALVAAAARAGVTRVVKVSGSDWTIEPPGRSISGDAHARVERALTESGLEVAILRPNGWMQVSLPPILAEIARGAPLSVGWGDGGIGMIDARDIADVAVNQLLARAPAPAPLVLTGPDVVTLQSIAADAARVLGRTIAVAPPSVADRGGPGVGFEERAVAEFMRLIASGAAAQTTGAVERVLGRPPRRVADYLAEQLGTVPA